MAASKEGKKKKKKKPVLIPVKKEEWPKKLNTGRKYKGASLVTRAFLPAYFQAILENPLEALPILMRTGISAEDTRTSQRWRG